VERHPRERDGINVAKPGASAYIYLCTYMHYKYVYLYADSNNVQAYIVSVVTFTVTLYLSKCAVVVFLLRLTKAVEQIRLYRVCLAILALSGVTSVLLVTIAWPSNNGFYWVGFNGHALCQTQVRSTNNMASPPLADIHFRSSGGTSSPHWISPPSSCSWSYRSVKYGTYR